jgi:hypothetical protein
VPTQAMTEPNHRVAERPMLQQSQKVSGLLMSLLLGLAMIPLPSAASGPITDCLPKDNARPICIFTNPEDMVPLPGNEAILVGEYGDASDGHAGSLSIFELKTETRRTAFRGGQAPADAELGWGDPSCKTPPTAAFNSHGIDLVRRTDGRLELIVVQHGGREALEFFELTGKGTDWQIIWRGCVLAPKDASLNEVVALPNGDFYTTKMASLAGAMDFENGMPTEPTGHAFAWTLKSGYRKIGGTEGVMPNGIASSPDGAILYMNASGDNSIRKIDVATGRELGRASVPSPDNVTWSPDGRLLVASLAGLDPADFASCQTLKRGACGIPFKIMAVDPETMTTLGPVYESTGAPMGAGTVGLQVGTELFIGSFKGDRILRVALPNDEK